MAHRHDDLFGPMTEFGHLLECARRAARGKRRLPGVAAFMQQQEKHVLALRRAMLDGSWQPGPYVTFEVHIPKHRVISAAPFRDRVVHHALVGAIGPIFERGFIHDSYANRTGKGIHAALSRFEHYYRRHRHVLRADIRRFFPAIDHAVLKADLRRRIACPRTLALADAIVDGSNPQEPVIAWFDGDDLFSPLARRRGLPIGNLTSQFFANVYLDRLDHFVKEVLRAPGYVRYVDDFALFDDCPERLAGWRARIEHFLHGRRLMLHPAKTFVADTLTPAGFVGYVLWPDGRRRVADDNVRRFAGTLRSLRARVRAGTADADQARKRVAAWVAHAEHADTWRLRHALFAGGPFDPARGAASPPLPAG